MIVAIEGEIIKKDPTFLYLKTYGITREIHISLNCNSKIDKNNISLYITQIIKEDSNNLYGFIDIQEKLMFDKVIKINGVGPSIAMAICSTFTPSAFAKAIASNDINSIKMVPGIGPKSAKRILVELSDFSLDFATSENRSYNETLQALESLGFKKDKIIKVLTGCTSTETSSLIKEALKKLS